MTARRNIKAATVALSDVVDETEVGMGRPNERLEMYYM